MRRKFPANFMQVSQKILIMHSFFCSRVGIKDMFALLPRSWGIYDCTHSKGDCLLWITSWRTSIGKISIFQQNLYVPQQKATVVVRRLQCCITIDPSQEYGALWDLCNRSTVRLFDWVIWLGSHNGLHNNYGDTYSVIKAIPINLKVGACRILGVAHVEGCRQMHFVNGHYLTGPSMGYQKSW